MYQLYQCTTPTHTFKLPIELTSKAKIRLTYKQDDKIVITKKTEDFVLDGEIISCKLSQDETLSLDHNKKVKIQLHVLTEEGTALISPPWYKKVGECLAGEVIA